MNDIQSAFGKLIKSAAIIFIGIVIARALALAAEVAIVRSLSPSVYGTIAVSYTIALVVGRIIQLGVPQGVTRFISADESGINSETIIKHGLLIVAPVSFLCGGLLLIFPTEISRIINNNRVSEYLPFFSLFVMTYPISRLAIAVLRARGETMQAILSEDLFSRIIGLVFFVGFVVIGAEQYGAVAYWVSLPLISVIFSVYYVSQNFKIYSILQKKSEWTSFQELWSFSWPLAISSSIILLLSNMDILMIDYFLSSEVVGYYRSVQPLRQVTGFVLSSFVFLYLPMATQFFSNGELESLSQFNKTTTKWVSSLTLPLVLVFSVFSEDIIMVLYGSTYLPASNTLAVLVAGLYFSTLVGPNGATTKAINRPRIELYSAGFGFVVNLVLNIVLIPRYGIIGAAFATVIGYMVYNTIEVILIYTAIGSTPFSTNQLKPIVPTVLVAFLFQASLNDFLNLLELMIIGIVISVVHIISMLVTQSIDQNDIEMIRRVEERLGRESVLLHKFIKRFS